MFTRKNDIWHAYTHEIFFVKQILHQKVAKNSRYDVTFKKYPFLLIGSCKNTDKILISKSAFEAYFPNLLNTFYRM